MAYLYLAIAIITEVIATSALKSSQEFSKLLPSLVVAVGYGLSFYFMTLTLRSIPLSITYAVWSGLGIVLVAVIGFILYQEKPDIYAVLGMTLIISGVLVIHLFSSTVAHS